MKKNYSLWYLFYPILALFFFNPMTYGQNEVKNYHFKNVDDAENGMCNGRIAVLMDPYEFHHLTWSTGDVTYNTVLEDLCPGDYSVTIYDDAEESSCRGELKTTVGGEEGCYIQYGTWNIQQIVYQECPPVDPGPAYVDTSGLYFGIDYWYIGTIQITPASGTDYIYEWGGTDSFGGDGLSNTTGEIVLPYESNDFIIRITNPLYPDCQVELVYEIRALCDVAITNESLGGKLDASKPTVIINEFSNGNDSFDEYVELLVIGDSDCNPIDLRNYILDDNNGSFSPEIADGQSGRGISPGHLRFPNQDNWNNVPVGSLIIIYNEKYKNTNIGADDIKDQNEDGVYILPASELKGDSFIPTLYNENYTYIEEYKEGYWGNIAMFDNNDAIQIRYPNGEYCHGISYGNTLKIDGGPKGMKLSYSDGKHKVYFFEGESPLAPQNYMTKATERYESPGLPNNDANSYYIASLCNRNIPIWGDTRKKLQAWVHPNPFETYLSLNIQAKEDYLAEISLVDFTGKVVLLQNENIIKGINKYRLNLEDDQIVSGLYNLRITAYNEVLFSQKVVCIK